MTQKLVKRAPERASSSRRGVRKSVAPMHDRSPYPRSSHKMKMIFGRGAACVSAACPTAAAAAATLAAKRLKIKDKYFIMER